MTELLFSIYILRKKLGEQITIMSNTKNEERGITEHPLKNMGNME